MLRIEYDAADIPYDAERIPLLFSAVPCGFPSPAEDYMERGLNLHEHYVRNPAATYFVRAIGESMIDAGIHSGDLLIVDRSLEARSGRVVIAAVDGELTVKRLMRGNGRVLLMPENPDYSPIDITEHEDATVWGVVTEVIHDL